MFFSLDNLVMSKRRSRNTTPMKPLTTSSANVTPIRANLARKRGDIAESFVSPSRGCSARKRGDIVDSSAQKWGDNSETDSRRKRGGDFAETSVVEGDTTGAESATESRGRRALPYGKGNHLLIRPLTPIAIP